MRRFVRSVFSIKEKIRLIISGFFTKFYKIRLIYYFHRNLRRFFGGNPYGCGINARGFYV